MDEEAVDSEAVSLITCMCFVRRGIAKAVPDKIELSAQELEAIIKQTAAQLSMGGAEDGSGEGSGDEEVRGEDADDDDPYRLERYDEEDARMVNPLSLAAIATLPNLGDLPPHVTIQTEGEDSDAEDDVIKPSDNLLVVGHVEQDACTLEVYVYNEEEGSLYVHHEALLSAQPLCVAWVGGGGNLAAVGTMEPVISLWDLDVENSVEPAAVLGRRASRRRGAGAGTARVGHRGAVLDLAASAHYAHVLASGGADGRALLWDLEAGTRAPHTTLRYFGGKVQCLAWHGLEPHTLAAGEEGAATAAGGGGAVRVADCRSSTAHRTYAAPGAQPVERLAWDPHAPYSLLATGARGALWALDVRATRPLWTVQAHTPDTEVTGLVVSEVKGLVATAGMDGQLKVWDCAGGGGGGGEGEGAQQVWGAEGGVGAALCLCAVPEAPLHLALAGDRKQRPLRMHLLHEALPVQERFSSRERATGTAAAAAASTAAPGAAAAAAAAP